MSNNTTTEFVLNAARAGYGSLKRVKGQRPQAVLAFLNAESDDQRDDAIEAHGAGFTRRGLHEAAVFFARKGDQETANAFEVLRDSIDDDGFTDFDVEVAEDAEPVNA